MTVLVIVGLSGVRLALLLLDGLLFVVLLGGDRLGEGEMDICLSGELISALRFLCGVCVSTCCGLFCGRGWRSAGFFSGFFFFDYCFVSCFLCIAFFVVPLVEGDW